MGRLTLRLPETLHHQLKAQAQGEGISLNQYVVYALTRQVTTAYTVRKIPEDEVEKQQERYSVLLQSLRQTSDAEIEQVLAEREVVEPPPDLSPEVVARLKKRIADSPRTP